MTAINGPTAAVTGGHRVLGKELAAQLLSRGATNVYATASRPHESGHARLIPVAAGRRDRPTRPGFPRGAVEIRTIPKGRHTAMTAHVGSGISCVSARIPRGWRSVTPSRAARHSTGPAGFEARHERCDHRPRGAHFTEPTGERRAAAEPNPVRPARGIRCAAGCFASGHRFPFETNVPGVFAAGDVRVASLKRVASAIGEGASAVRFIHTAIGLHP
jgi:hypothetical protein